MTDIKLQIEDEKRVLAELIDRRTCILSEIQNLTSCKIHLLCEVSELKKQRDQLLQEQEEKLNSSKEEAQRIMHEANKMHGEALTDKRAADEEKSALRRLSENLALERESFQKLRTSLEEKLNAAIIQVEEEFKQLENRIDGHRKSVIADIKTQEELKRKTSIMQSEIDQRIQDVDVKTENFKALMLSTEEKLKNLSEREGALLQLKNEVAGNRDQLSLVEAEIADSKEFIRKKEEVLLLRRQHLDSAEANLESRRKNLDIREQRLNKIIEEAKLEEEMKKYAGNG